MKATGFAFAACLIGLGGPLAGLEPARVFERDVDVAAAGWVRVPLDLEALRHSTPDGGDLRVIGPAGDEVPRLLASPPARPGRRQARVIDVKPEGGAEGGWRLTIDAGEGTPAHEQLIFDLDKRTAATAVKLEGSTDLRSWQPLAEGDLFRLGEGDGELERTALSYPPTSVRYLRLAWPKAAGFPEVRDVDLELSAGPSIALATGDTTCDRGGNGAVSCRIDLPAPGTSVRRIELSLSGAGPVGYLLEAPDGGRWSVIAQGVWQRPNPEGSLETRHLLNLDGPVTTGDFLRLGLYAAGTPPDLSGVRLEIAPREVAFRAEIPGRYTLVYGAGAGAAPRLETAAEENSAELAAGPERARPAPPLPAAADPGATLALEAFPSSWEVAAPGAAAGDVVRLEIPDGVYAAARADLGDLRLATGTRQIPYIRRTSPEPVRAAVAWGMRAEPERSHGWSRVELDLPAVRSPWTQVSIATPGGPLRRPLEVLAVRPRNPEPAGRETMIASTLWECNPMPPLPCRALLPIEGPGASRIAVRFEDGDNAPLTDVELAVWRRRDALVFVWPGSAKVRLLAGAEAMAAPAYDLAALSGELLGRPWQAGELAPVVRDEPRGLRFLLPIVLGLAGIGLLLLLRRILATE
ncbi:MAG TPA: DUF3999 family protein [Thermoanaerobaculia bacterium]|jgi:hypothetical protein|nr:DUF3999 family protein [Thermoanaerobaculia bacterium]